MSRPAFNRSKDGWFLLQSGFTKDTLAAYRRHVRWFLEWCRVTNVPFHTVKTPEQLDDLVTEYLHYRYEMMDGGGRQGGENLVNGLVMLLPRLDGQLSTARHALTQWKKIVPPQPHPPLTWELAVVIAVQMSRHGYYRYAVGLLLSFVCLLRVSEMSALRREHILDSEVFTPDGRSLQKVIVVIPFAKTGTDQSVEIADPAVIELVRGLVARTARGKPLFPGGVSAYRRVFNKIRDELRLSPRYGTHSCRHGGATLLYMQRVPIEDILLIGRWKSNSSARTYIQKGPAIIAQTQAPVPVLTAARVLVKDVVLALSLSQSLH